MQKAKFNVYSDEQGKNIKFSFHVLFNPTQYVIRKSAQYENTENLSVGGPNTAPSNHTNYKGPKDQTLSVELFLDTTTNDMEGTEDVSDYANLFLELAEAKQDGNDKENLKPPLVGFEWGSVFIGYIDSVDITYMMFTSEGMPVRAKVNLSLTKAQLAQASASAAPPDEKEQTKTITIQNFADLCSAARLSGDTVMNVCEKNGISDPLNIQPGKTIEITISG